MKLLVGKNADAGADVDCNDHCLADFGDLRFTKADGETLLDYFLKSYSLFGKSFLKYRFNPLTLPLQGANGVVHPDVLYFDSAVDGYKYWMVYTPYPPDASETPCIVRSNDGITWVETGITNPVISLGGTGEWDEYHCADPSMVYVSDYSKWFIAYAGSKSGAGKEPLHNNTTVGLAYSSDGKSWTKLGVLVDGTASYEKYSDTNERNCYQPSLTYEGGVFYLWYVTGAAGGTTFLGNNRGKLLLATFTWNNTTNVVENFTRDGGNPIAYPAEDSDFKSGLGHVHVSLYNGIYYMYCVREIVASVNFELALFTCTDKKTWIYQGKVLARNADWSWEALHIYRSSPLTDALKNIVVDANKQFTLFYSGYASTGYPLIGQATSERPIAKFFIEFDSIGTGATTFYMYYGKADATSVSNIINTFIKGDDGVAGSFTEAVSGTGALSHGSGEYTLTEDSTDDCGIAGAILADWAFEATINKWNTHIGGTTAGHQSIVGLFDSDTVAHLIGTAAVAGPKRRFYFMRYNSNAATNPNKISVLYQDTGGTFHFWTGSAWTTTATVLTANSNLVVKIWSDGTNFLCDIFSGGVSLFTSPASIAIASVKAFASGKCLAWGDFYTDAYYITHSIDDYFVRQYLDPEPAWGSWGAEETPGSASMSPSASPSLSPSPSPSLSPSASLSPSESPSLSPSASLSPSISPSESPSESPSLSPSASLSPSISPSASPSLSPSISPSLSPSISPSLSPSASLSPSISPSKSPSASPSASPSCSPSMSPSASPSKSPSESPSRSPSMSASRSPSKSPSPSPSASPSPQVAGDFEFGDWVRDIRESHGSSYVPAIYYIY
jgi:hypothetical protein